MMIAGMKAEGGSGTSWTSYPPLRSEGHYGIRVDLTILRLHNAGVSRLVARFNFIATVLCGKGPLPLESVLLFIWTLLVTTFLLVLRLPVLACGLTILLFDRNENRCFFECRGGGNPLLYQHLF